MYCFTKALVCFYHQLPVGKDNINYYKKDIGNNSFELNKLIKEKDDDRRARMLGGRLAQRRVKKKATSKRGASDGPAPGNVLNRS